MKIKLKVVPPVATRVQVVGRLSGARVGDIDYPGWIHRHYISTAASWQVVA